MPFAQTNYQQKLGNGPYTIAQVGCFLTAFSNLLERFGEPVDPPSLNVYFIQHNQFLLAPEDGAGVRDDLNWGTISGYDGNIHVTSSGNGAPSSNDAIVKFIYKSIHTGALTTHFCLVVDAAKGLILDSWDGKVKSWNVYGGPVAYAVYARTAPVQVAPAPAPAPSGKKLFLPSPAGTWRVYNLSGPYSVGHEVGKLAPGNFPPGLTYDVLGNIAPNIVKIHTQSFGDVAIYVGSDTIAQFVDNAPLVPTPTSAANVPAPVAPTPPANNRYTRFPSPLNLVTNKQPTRTWDISATSWAGFHDDKDLDQGTPFVAVGKFQHPLGGVYFMNEEQFGQADTTGVPAIHDGINTVDLSPPPATPAPAAAASTETPTSTASSDSEAVNISVKVNTWQSSFKEAVGTYKAVSDAKIKDLAGKLADQDLGHDQLVHIAGTVTKDGEEYYVTVKSHVAGNWYGIPKNLLVAVTVSSSKAVNAVQHPLATAHRVLDDIDQIAAELNKDPEFKKFKTTLTPRGKAVATIAEAEEKVDGFFSKVNLFKKKNK